MANADDGYELEAFARQLGSLSRELAMVQERLNPLLGTAKDDPQFRVRGLKSLDDVEREYVQFVLRELDGNKTRAASVLGVDASTLHRKLARWEEV